MNKAKREALEAAGFRVGDYGDFLGLTDAERQLVELRVQLGRLIRERRQRAKMTQEAFAGVLGSTQPRVAKIEAGARGVSLDQMFRAYVTVGGKLPAILAGSRAKTKPSKKAKFYTLKDVTELVKK
jgi:DNA-binding XRE family transcriptional regulator